MSLGFRDEIGGISFPVTETHIPRTSTAEAVDSSGELYEKDVQGRIIIPKIDPVMSANSLTGDVEWVGGHKIRVTTLPRSNRIKISFDSSAESSSAESSSEDPEESSGCADPSGGGGVNPSDDDDPSGGGGGVVKPSVDDPSGGVPAGGGDEEHGGGARCCD